MTKPIPDGYHSITPTLTIRDASSAIEFYKKAFGATEVSRFLGPDGKTIMHAEIKIGDSLVMLGEENQQMGMLSPKSTGSTSSGIFLYVDEVDAVFDKAISAGAKVKMPVTDMFWGDRFASVEDPYGHAWAIATHKKDMTHEEIKNAGEEFFKNMCK
ncbi:MAG: VOC family protein [Thaumarchaeota archaeon]|nr:VOC family protein [Nitrososphaerota archaeon]MDE1843216.1 VOC family protein [Nitrososphaerota archaeon]